MALAAGVLLLGGFVQGFAGFGLALTSVPLLSLFLDVRTAVPLAGLFGWLVTVPIVLRMANHVQWKTGLWLVLGALPGSFLGADLLRSLPTGWLLAGMGLLLCGASAYSLWSRPIHFPRTGLPVTMGCGFCAGVIGAAVGEPGPPVVAYMNFQPWTAHQIKSTLNFFFLLQMLFALTAFLWQGLLTAKVWTGFGVALPGMLIGMTSGMFLYDTLHRREVNFHKILHAIVLVLGLLLLVKAFHLLHSSQL